MSDPARSDPASSEKAEPARPLTDSADPWKPFPSRRRLRRSSRFDAKQDSSRATGRPASGDTPASSTDDARPR